MIRNARLHLEMAPKRTRAALLELRADDILQLLLAQEGLVAVFVEAILVDSSAFVAPKPTSEAQRASKSRPDEQSGGVHHLRVRLADALEDTAQVPQGEDVVEPLPRLGKASGRRVPGGFVGVGGKLSSTAYGLISWRGDSRRLVQAHGHLRQL